MEQNENTNKKIQELIKQDPWMQYIPLSRILDLIIQILRQDADRQNLPIEILENLLPHLCFALPPVAQNCSKLLNILGRKSSIWTKLEKGLKEGKHLPLEIVVLLYENHLPALERKILNILGRYAEKTYCKNHYQELFQIFAEAHCSSGFKACEIEINGNSKCCPSKVNFWSESLLGQAAACSSTIFNYCFNILCKLCIDTKFSLGIIVGSQDFFVELKQHLNGELYEVFHNSIQHIVYLLTVPLTFHEKSKHVQTIENCMQEKLNDGNENLVLQCLLCFFPQWISILAKREFFNQNLRQCECFGSFSA